MRRVWFLFLLLLTCGQAQALDLDDLYLRLQQDFETKPHFWNSNLNDERTGVPSSFINGIMGYEHNNAQPLSTTQIKNLPDAYFVSKKVFNLAMKGRDRLLKAGKIKDHPLVVVADLSLHSRVRRLYVLDIKRGEVLMNTWVSHASGSDEDKDGFAETFSNVPKSNLSSAGFQVTDVAPYTGQWGYSLRMRGLDPQLNSNVFSRAVVIHGWASMGAHEASWGKSATSWGCLMVSMAESGRFWGLEDKPLHQLLIDTVKGGALVFTYTDIENDNYILKSEWIKRQDIPIEEVEPSVPKPAGDIYEEEEATEDRPIVSHRNPFRPKRDE